MLVRSFVLSLLLGAVVAPDALACDAGPAPTYRADFRSPGPGWLTESDLAYFQDGQLVVKPEANRIKVVTMEAMRFASATYCAQFKMPADLPSDSPTGAGLAFWRADGAYYELQIFPDRTFDFERLVNGSWDPILSRGAAFDKINAGPGAINEIKVVARDGRVTAYFNDAKAFDVVAQMPPGGGTFGAFAESTPQARSEWRFLELVAVANVADPVGRYALSGVVSGGGKYSGSVTVEKGDDGYRIMRTVDGKTSEGVGILSDNRLSTAFPAAHDEAVATYTRTDQGWSGTVITPTAPVGGNLNETLATESWTRN